MLWQVDPTSRTPLYEQLAASVRRELADGTLAAGTRLPSAREVAASLDINLHTVLRAYQELRDDGLVELRRGRGAVVTGTDPGATARLTTLAATLAREARRLGVPAADLTALVERVY